MAREHEDFGKALQQIVEAVMFENWLRFYFVTEKPSAPKNEQGETPLFMGIPVQAMSRIQELYPHLFPLAVDINGKELDFAASQQAICLFVANELTGKSMTEGMSNMVLNSERFAQELQLFSAWVQSHEESLDQNFTEFGMWRSAFAGWRNSEKVQEWAKEMKNVTVVQGSGTA